MWPLQAQPEEARLHRPKSNHAFQRGGSNSRLGLLQAGLPFEGPHRQIDGRFTWYCQQPFLEPPQTFYFSGPFYIVLYRFYMDLWIFGYMDIVYMDILIC